MTQNDSTSRARDSYAAHIRARRHAVITCKLYTKFVTFTVAIRKKFE